MSSFHFATHDNLSGIVRVYVDLKSIYFKVLKFMSSVLHFRDKGLTGKIPSKIYQANYKLLKFTDLVSLAPLIE